MVTVSPVSLAPWGRRCARSSSGERQVTVRLERGSCIDLGQALDWRKVSSSPHYFGEVLTFPNQLRKAGCLTQGGASESRQRPQSV